MKTILNNIKEDFDKSIKKVAEGKNIQDIKELQVKFLGKKGLINEQMQNLKNSDNKKEIGKHINELKTEISEAINNLQKEFNETRRDQKLKESEVDVTLNISQKDFGKQNILIKTQRDVEDTFRKLGFEVALGQEVETDYYNFEALNLKEDHPARDMQDSFYINPKTLLRTHTSNIQSRVLEANDDKEIKIICPGKVYRRDDDDATHSHQFTQLEGLVVVKKGSEYTASLKDLKQMLTYFVREIFEENNLNIRLRPSFFPFTEPSVEVDVSCSHCQGKGCSFCKSTGWIEILGAGIINPHVLDISGYSSEEYTGYAFGLGLERIALLKHSITDIRLLYQNSAAFINQF